MGSAYYFFVYKPSRIVAVDAGYVLPPSVQVVDTPAEVRIVVGSVKSGERVDILKRTAQLGANPNRRQLDRLGGELSDLLDSQTYESGQKLLRDLAKTPAQAEGHTSGFVNLHLEPSRDAAQLAQLPENLKVQVFGRRWVDRPPPDGQPSAAKVRDAWYLIRAGDQRRLGDGTIRGPGYSREACPVCPGFEPGRLGRPQDGR